MKIITWILLAWLLTTYNLKAQDTLINILSDEITREMDGLSTQSIAPYYIEYRVDDIKTYNITTSFGSLINKDEDNGRILTATVRVGNYNFDNTHEIEGSGGLSQPFVLRLPFENVSDAIRQSLWLATQYAYRNAVNMYNQVLSSNSDENKRVDSSDFTKEAPVTYYEAPVEKTLKNSDEWVKRLKQYSEPFLSDDKVVSANATLSYVADRKYFVSTEGSRIVQNLDYCQLQITAETKSDDGNIVPLFLSYYAFTPEELFFDNNIMNDVNDMLGQLKQLRTAPVADAYSGPAILSPSAAAVFFHEIFGHRIEGHRMKSDSDGQTLKEKIGTYVLPKYMDIISDPTLSRLYNQDMFGYYKFDEQGIKAQKITIVKNGILENFLMSRNPINRFSNSNGHGRAQAGLSAVARQSNLIVETRKPVSFKELRKKLISECKKQNKEYGFLFDQVFGGFTLTTRYMPNVFNVKPTKVYKIYVDGRPDELVRGVDFIGTPLSVFSEIGATGDSTGIFTGYCGAESGSIPVTAVSPALFIKKIETQKHPENYGQMPILPRPDVEKIIK